MVRLTSSYNLCLSLKWVKTVVGSAILSARGAGVAFYINRLGTSQAVLQLSARAHPVSHSVVPVF